MAPIAPTDRVTFFVILAPIGRSAPPTFALYIHTPRALKGTRTSLRVHTHACLAISRSPSSCHSPQLFILTVHLFVFFSLGFYSTENISNLVRRRCILCLSGSRPSNEFLCTPKEGKCYLVRDMSVYQSSSPGRHLQYVSLLLRALELI